LKNRGFEVSKSSITQPRISLKFGKYFTTWHPIYCTSSRSMGQRSRSQRDMTYQHHEIVTFHEEIGWLSLNIVQIIA